MDENTDSTSQNVRSTTTAGGGLANKISLCISRVLSNSQSNIENSEDLEDLIFLVQELNEHEELNVKLSSATKISKLLHDVQTDEEFTDVNDSSMQGPIHVSSINFRQRMKHEMRGLKPDPLIRQILDSLREKLETL